MAKRATKEYKLKAQTQFRVRFSEVDMMQIVWHGNYAKYFEDAREAFGLSYPGLGYMEIYNNGYTAPIVEMSIQYKSSIRYNEAGIVEIRYIPSEAAKICFEYEIREAKSLRIVATGTTTQVFLDEKGDLQLNTPQFYQAWQTKWNVE